MSSGMGAISSTLWTVLKAGDHVITDTTLYGCTFALMNHGLTKFGVEVSFVDTSDLEAVKKAMKKNTRVVRSEEHTSELQSRQYLVCRLLLEKKKSKHSLYSVSD